MGIADFLKGEDVAISLPARSKKQFLEDLARRVSLRVNLDAEDIFDLLIEREKLGTTGIGSGVAIPHGKHPRLEHLYGFFARAEVAIDFEAIDDQPVDLVFLLLAPEAAGADHLKALACVSRALRGEDIRQSLREAATEERVYAILTEAGLSDKNRQKEQNEDPPPSET